MTCHSLHKIPYIRQRMVVLVVVVVVLEIVVV